MGFGAKLAPPECSIPWSTGRIDTWPVPARRPEFSSHCRLRSTFVGRSVSTKMRSTKSGPGRCSWDAGKVSQRWLSRESASSPRSSSRREEVSSAVAAMSEDVTAGYAPARPMEHNFTSTGYTIGIEEELMIVDAETLELANAIDQLLANDD